MGGASSNPERVHSAAVLRHFVERLYRDAQVPLLFTRSGNKARLSDSALKMLAALDIKVEK